MEKPAKPRATYQDVLDAPDHMIAELIDGELVLSPWPKPRHSAVLSALGAELGQPFHRGRGGPGGWMILDEPEIHLGDDVLVPDLAGWRRERMPYVPDDYPTIAPDWVCEILSKSTEKRDRVVKMPLYAAAGVRFAWIIHPVHRTLEAMRLHDGRWLVTAYLREDQRGRVEPFDAIELDLAHLWEDLAPPTRASEGVSYEPEYW